MGTQTLSLQLAQQKVIQWWRKCGEQRRKVERELEKREENWSYKPCLPLPSSTDEWRGSVGFQSDSGRVLRPSSDGAFISPGLLSISAWGLPPRRISSPCQARLDFQSSVPTDQPLLLPSSWLEARGPNAPRWSPSEGARPLRSSCCGSQTGLTLNSDSVGEWTCSSPRPPATPTGKVWPFFT